MIRFGRDCTCLRRPQRSDRLALRRNCLDKFLASITLRIKQRSEIAMIDAGAGDFAQRRFGVKGDAEPGRFDHRRIIGAVANRKRLFAPQS